MKSEDELGIKWEILETKWAKKSIEGSKISSTISRVKVNAKDGQMTSINHNGGKARLAKHMDHHMDHHMEWTIWKRDQTEDVKLMLTAKIPKIESVQFQISQVSPTSSSKMAKIDWSGLLIKQAGEWSLETLTKKVSMTWQASSNHIWMTTTADVNNQTSADHMTNDQRVDSSKSSVCQAGNKHAVVEKNAHVTHTRIAMMAVSVLTLTCQTLTTTATSKANRNLRGQLSTQGEWSIYQLIRTTWMTSNSMTSEKESKTS